MQPSKGGVRGASWRAKETQDLLEIWGDRQTQEALRASHRNFGTYEKIAAEMAARGHSRTAEECRTKTKSFRMEYRRGLAQGGQLGRFPATSPLFNELNSIMRVGGGAMPRRGVGKGSCYQGPLATAGPGPSFPPQLGLEDFFMRPMTAVNHDHVHESSTEAEDCGYQEEEEEDSDAAFTENFPEQGQASEDPVEGLPGGEMAGPTQGDNTGNGEVSVGEGWPSPNSKIAKPRAKRRRVPGLVTVSERLMEHSGLLFERDLEERRRENEVASREWAEDREERRLAREQEHRDRMLVYEALQQNIKLLDSAVEAFKELVSIQRTRATLQAGLGAGAGDGATQGESSVGSGVAVAAGTPLGSVPGVAYQDGPSDPPAASAQSLPLKRMKMKKKLNSP